MNKKLKIVLDGEKPISWNKVYAGRHWKYRADLAFTIHRRVRNVLLDMGWIPQDPKMFQKPVEIDIKAYFSGRMYDPDNISSKFYIDALKTVVILDDSPKYVHSVKTTSLSDKFNPRLEIEIKEASA